SPVAVRNLATRARPGDLIETGGMGTEMSSVGRGAAAGASPPRGGRGERAGRAPFPGGAGGGGGRAGGAGGGRGGQEGRGRGRPRPRCCRACRLPGWWGIRGHRAG